MANMNRPQPIGRGILSQPPTPMPRAPMGMPNGPGVMQTQRPPQMQQQQPMQRLSPGVYQNAQGQVIRTPNGQNPNMPPRPGMQPPPVPRPGPGQPPGMNGMDPGFTLQPGQNPFTQYLNQNPYQQAMPPGQQGQAPQQQPNWYGQQMQLQNAQAQNQVGQRQQQMPPYGPPGGFF